MGPAEDIELPPSQREPGYSLDISPGQLCVISFNGEKQKYKSSIIGLEQYQFIILRLPSVPGIQQKLSQIQSITVRLEYQGTLWGFTSQVLKVIATPIPMVLMAYPHSAERLQLRKYKRTPCFMPARLKSQKIDTEGLITDISLGGCRMVFTSDNIEQVTEIISSDMLKLSMPTGPEALIELDATLRNYREVKHSPSVGLCFTGSEKDRELSRFVAMMENARDILEQDQ